MPSRPCAGPAPGIRCTSGPNGSVSLVAARPGSKTAARCGSCARQWQHAKDQRRPERRTYAEQERRRKTVAEWVVLHGYVCPGIEGEQPPHPSMDLTADHVDPVAAGGREDGPLVVRCRPCNSAKAARLSG